MFFFPLECTVIFVPAGVVFLLLVLTVAFCCFGDINRMRKKLRRTYTRIVSMHFENNISCIFFLAFQRCEVGEYISNRLKVKI